MTVFPTQTANKAIAALSGTPMLLVLVLLNVSMLVLIAFLLTASAKHRFAERAELVSALRQCIQLHVERSK